jgi:hypothetical protein
MNRYDKGAFADQSRHMSEPELMDTARHYDELVEAAKSSLREEFKRRSLEPPLIDDPVSPTEDQLRDSTATLVTIARYRDLAEAFIARSVLEGQGIPCFLCDENFVRLDWGYSNFIGGMRLQVSSDDEEYARELLTEKAPESIEVPGEPLFIQPICPKCSSDDIVAYDPGLKLAATSALFFVTVPTRLTPKTASGERWHCMNCGCNWQDDGEPTSPSHN